MWLEAPWRLLNMLINVDWKFWPQETETIAERPAHREDCDLPLAEGPARPGVQLSGERVPGLMLFKFY